MKKNVFLFSVSCLFFCCISSVSAQPMDSPVFPPPPPMVENGVPALSGEDAALLEFGTPDIAVPDGMAPEELVLIQVTQEMRAELDRLEKLDKGLPSLFFNKEEQVRLAEAMAVYEAESGRERETAGLPTQKQPLPDVKDFSIFSFVREISLGGIVFRGEGDWIVWLNKQRLTPERLPPEIRGINVYKEYVDIKWYDEQTNKIIPIRLRTNQRYNLDSRVFLPG